MPGTCLGTINTDCIKSDEKNSVQKQLSAVVYSTKTTNGTEFVSRKHLVVCCSILLCVNFYTQQLMGMMMQWATRTKGETLSVLRNLNRFFSWGSMWGVSETWPQSTRPSWDGNDISYTLYSPHINSASEETGLDVSERAFTLVWLNVRYFFEKGLITVTLGEGRSIKLLYSDAI